MAGKRLTATAEGNAERIVVRHERRRQEILTVAARRFAAYGYAGTSLEDVAEELGLTKGSLYHYVESKQSLLLGIAVDHTQRIASAARTAGAIGPSPDTRLMRLLTAHIEQVCDAPEGRLFHLFERHVIGSEDIEGSPLMRQLRREIAEYTAFVCDIVREAVVAGLVRVSSVELTTESLLSCANSAGHAYLRQQPPIPPAAFGVEIAAMLVGGLVMPFRPMAASVAPVDRAAPAAPKRRGKGGLHDRT